VSLIGDALRKARKEAAERETDRRGVLFSAKINDSPSRSNLGLGLALGAVIAVVATVAGGGMVWWLLGRDQPQESARHSTVSTTDTATVSAIPTQIPSSGAAEPEDSPRSSVAAVPTPSAEPVGSGPNTPRGGPQPEPTIAPTPVAAAVEDEAGEGFIGIEDGDEVFVMEADLGRVRLSLDYIVFRNDDPFAEINGIELHLGGVVDGFRVKAIERDRVRLSDGRRSIVLRAP